MRVSAPAKTNLFLEVPRRRPDGFHELDTVFAELALADELKLLVNDEGCLELRLDPPQVGIPLDSRNLALRAAELLRAHAGRSELGAHITLTKRIPAGGGLGGGSSDAAAVLRGLDAAWKLDSSAETLFALAAELGSDVAFFLRGGLQRGRGRGELLEPLPCPPRPLDLVLLLPEFPCPTPAVYGALAPFLPSEPRRPESLLRALAAGTVAEVGQELFNRLEAAACALFPELTALKRMLAGRPGVQGTLLSGSGSTLVALLSGPAEASALSAALQQEGHKALATQTVSGAG